MDNESNEFFDPLRAMDDNEAVVTVDVSQESETSSSTRTGGLYNGAFMQKQEKEWSSFKRFLTQRFPVSKMVQVSYVSIYFLMGYL